MVHASASERAGGGHPGRVDFSQAPFLVIWETTRSCGLACKHCRAEAIYGRDPDELTTEQGKKLLDDVATMGTPICILSGGDPLNRPDLEELTAHGKARGLRMGTIPAATASLTRARIHGLKQAGIDQIAFSLDGPTAALHDGFRGVPGSFERTLEGVAHCHAEGVPLQINTCFASWNFQHLEAMIALVKGLGIVFWEVFFLVPMGRGRQMDSLRPHQFEEAFARLYDLSREAPFIVKVTEAQHYRRYVTLREEGAGHSQLETEARIQDILARPRGVGGSLGMSPKAVNSGKGFLFVDHLGNVCPSGFLPTPCGNVKHESLADVYRHHPLFVRLRDPGALHGKCGACAFSDICGGSRARAFALTDDPFATDPFCAYAPPGWKEHVVAEREHHLPMA